jgi:hypothetical protein
MAAKITGIYWMCGMYGIGNGIEFGYGYSRGIASYPNVPKNPINPSSDRGIKF